MRDSGYSLSSEKKSEFSHLALNTPSEILPNILSLLLLCVADALDGLVHAVDGCLMLCIYPLPFRMMRLKILVFMMVVFYIVNI